MNSTGQTDKMGTNARFVCAICATAQPKAGFCSEHSDEPLLDSHDPSVVAYLTSLDEATLRERVKKNTIAVGILGIVVGMIIVYAVENTTELAPSTAMEVAEIIVILGCFAVLNFARRRIITRYEYRFTPWTNACKNRPTHQDLDDAKEWRFETPRSHDFK